MKALLTAENEFRWCNVEQFSEIRQSCIDARNGCIGRRNAIVQIVHLRSKIVGHDEEKIARTGQTGVIVATSINTRRTPGNVNTDLDEECLTCSSTRSISPSIQVCEYESHQTVL